MAPQVGLEPTTLRLTAACSTDWAIEAYINRQQTIFPGGLPPSIFIAIELNFCVRYGNRWVLYALSPVWLKVFRFSVLSLRFSFSFTIYFEPSTFVSSKPNNTLTFYLSVFVLHLPSSFSLGFGQALGLLVSVSLIHYCTYTSDLSNTSSTCVLTVSNMANLISRGASHLDAFSDNPFHT